VISGRPPEQNESFGKTRFNNRRNSVEPITMIDLRVLIVEHHPGEWAG
jgi:hypothetical protein